MTLAPPQRDDADEYNNGTPGEVEWRTINPEMEAPI